MSKKTDPKPEKKTKSLPMKKAAKKKAATDSIKRKSDDRKKKCGKDQTQANTEKQSQDLSENVSKKVSTKQSGNVPGVSSRKKVAKKKAGGKTDNNQKAKKKSTGGRNYKVKGTNGGKRKGSGRKKGATTKKTRAIADKLVADGEITPLEYMLEAMRETPAKLKKQFKAGKIDQTEYAVKLMAMIKRRDAAAEKAAPYIHPRLSSIDANINTNDHEKFLALLEESENASTG